MSSVITIQNLSKKYIINHQKQERYTALRDVLANGAKRFTRNLLHQTVPENDPAHEEFWALKDVSFDIQQGDRVGIIGRNGAGKSTLLKVLSRITEPTSGKVKIKGRVASLLEVGTGFHPELTGRENIYLNGAILGMSKAEIKKKFDEIVAFAEVEKFLDTPVKRYSSGMYVRLAFAVAAHLEPEILIVDEVLAVGDAQFQKKCLGKMDEVGKAGRTLFFVSHNMAAVQNLCNRGIYLSDGRVKHIGSEKDAIAKYLNEGANQPISLATRIDRQGTQEVRVIGIAFFDMDDQPISEASAGQELKIRFYFERLIHEDLSNIVASIRINSSFDVPVFLHHNRLLGLEFGILPPKGYFEFCIPRLPLPPSSYSITYSLLKDGVCLDSVTGAAEMTVVAGDFFQSGEIPPPSHGLCLVDGNWGMYELSDDEAN